MAYVDYKVYVKTDEWLQKKHEAFDHYGNNCFCCGGIFGLDVHHNNYIRVGNEEMRDLVIICDDCHTKVHNWDESYRWSDVGCPLIIGHEVLRLFLILEKRTFTDDEIDLFNHLYSLKGDPMVPENSTHIGKRMSELESSYLTYMSSQCKSKVLREACQRECKKRGLV